MSVILVFGLLIKDADVFTILPSVKGSASVSNDELFSMLQVTMCVFQ